MYGSTTFSAAAVATAASTALPPSSSMRSPAAAASGCAAATTPCGATTGGRVLIETPSPSGSRSSPASRLQAARDQALDVITHAEEEEDQDRDRRVDVGGHLRSQVDHAGVRGELGQPDRDDLAAQVPDHDQRPDEVVVGRDRPDDREGDQDRARERHRDVPERLQLRGAVDPGRLEELLRERREEAPAE